MLLRGVPAERGMPCRPRRAVLLEPPSRRLSRRHAVMTHVLEFSYIFLILWAETEFCRSKRRVRRSLKEVRS